MSRSARTPRLEELHDLRREETIAGCRNIDSQLNERVTKLLNARFDTLNPGTSGIRPPRYKINPKGPTIFELDNRTPLRVVPGKEIHLRFATDGPDGFLLAHRIELLFTDSLAALTPKGIPEFKGGWCRIKLVARPDLPLGASGTLSHTLETPLHLFEGNSPFSVTDGRDADKTTRFSFKVHPVEADHPNVKDGIWDEDFHADVFSGKEANSFDIFVSFAGRYWLMVESSIRDDQHKSVLAKARNEYVETVALAAWETHKAMLEDRDMGKRMGLNPKDVEIGSVSRHMKVWARRDRFIRSGRGNAD